MDIHKIKILGVSEIEEALDIKKDYSIVLKRCDVRNIVKKQTNEDDNYIYTYSLENLDIITLLDEGKTIKGIIKKPSQSMRGLIYLIGNERGVEDSEQFYRDSMVKIMDKIPTII